MLIPCEIVSVTDLDGNPKDLQLWGDKRILGDIPTYGKPIVFLKHTLDGYRMTSKVQSIRMYPDKPTEFTTLNSIYSIRGL